MDAIGQTNNRFIRQLLFIGILLAIGVIIFKQLAFFLGSFLSAITLYTVLRDPYFKLVDKYKWRHWVASLLIVSLTTLVLLGLGYLIFEVVASEIPSIDTSQIIVGFNDFLAKINDFVGYKVISDNLLSESRGFIGKLASTVLNTTYSLAANVFMMLIIVYFMFTGGRKMERKAWEYAPFKGRSLALLKKEIKNMIYSNAVGIPAIMFVQALVASLIYWLLGFNNVIFWSFLTAICGLIPIVGTGIVYVPLGVYLMASGHIWGGIILILYGLLVISNADNVFRIILMKKVANTHPLIVVFGVILGIPLFGFWGIIFGPLLISAFILLIKIYYVEYELIPAKRIRK